MPPARGLLDVTAGKITGSFRSRLGQIAAAWGGLHGRATVGKITGSFRSRLDEFRGYET